MDELKNFLTQVGTRSHSSLFVRRGIQQEGAYRLDVRIRPLPYSFNFFIVFPFWSPSCPGYPRH